MKKYVKYVGIFLIILIILIVMLWTIYKKILVEEVTSVKNNIVIQPKIEKLDINNIDGKDKLNNKSYTVKKENIAFNLPYEDIIEKNNLYQNNDLNVILLNNVSYEPQEKSWYDRRIDALKKSNVYSNIDEELYRNAYKRFESEFHYRKSQLENKEYSYSIFTSKKELDEIKLLYEEQSKNELCEKIYEFSYEGKKGFVTANTGGLYIISILQPETKISSIVILKNETSDYIIDINEIKYVISSFKQENI